MWAIPRFLSCRIDNVIVRGDKVRQRCRLVIKKSIERLVLCHSLCSQDNTSTIYYTESKYTSSLQYQWHAGKYPLRKHVLIQQMLILKKMEEKLKKYICSVCTKSWCATRDAALDGWPRCRKDVCGPRWTIPPCLWMERVIVPLFWMTFMRLHMTEKDNSFLNPIFFPHKGSHNLSLNIAVSY